LAQAIGEARRCATAAVRGCADADDVVAARAAKLEYLRAECLLAGR
jgi:hypothetical protein